MSENVEITVADRLGYLVNDLNRCRQAITYRGGTVSAKEGLMDIPDSIANIPLSSSIGTVTDDSLDSIKLIPSNSVPACYIKSIGGMTYKCENLMPFPYVVNGGDYGIGDEQYREDTTFSVNADRNIEISRVPGSAPNEALTLTVNVASSDYYLTVFKKDATEDDFLTVTSNVGNIPFGESVFIPSSTGITYITLTTAQETSGSCTISIILSKYPYFEGLKDTKTTAVKVHGSNLFDYTKAFADWRIFNYSKEGDTITVNHTWGDGFGYRYQFTDKPQICTISVDASSTSADGVRLVLGYLENNVFTPRGDFYLGRETTSVTSSRIVNAIRWDYPNGISGTIVSTLKGLRVNYGSADCGYYPYHEEPITYEIPEALQGTGKGVEGVADTVDFENGKKITRVGEADLSDLIWAIAPYGFYSYGLKTKFIGNLILSADYTTDTWSNVYSEKTDRCISGNGSAIIISDSRYTDETSFKASLVGKKILYALAEPTEESIDTSIFNNIPTVEPGGYLEFVTDNGFAPNSSVLFQTIP